MDLPDFPSGLRAPSDFLPEQPPQLEDHFDLEDMLAAANRDAILDVAADDKELALQGRANLVREAVIAERLWLLGYLKDSSDLASSARRAQRKRFLSAVGLFQSGAGLKVDQWSGAETWKALQELVTFENPTRVASYAVDGVALPALVRATRLRLWSLGFLRRKPTTKSSSEQIPADALEKFWLICTRFKLEASDRPQPPVLDLIHKLFDQDRLLDAVATAGRLQQVGGRERWVFSYLKRSSEKRRNTDPEVESFLVCLAKIELWLLGFDIDINPARNFPVYLFSGSATRRNQKINAALRQFWQQFGSAPQARTQEISGAERRREKRDKQRLEDSITPELFRALADPQFAGTSVGTGSDVVRAAEAQVGGDERSREVTEKLQTHAEINNVWSRGKSLGMKLWDGARRVWRWLRRGFIKILDVGRNLVRAFFRYSTKAFEIAKLALKTVASSVMQYAMGAIKTGNRVQILVARDGDIRAAFPVDVSAQDLMTAAHQLRYFGAAFHLSCRILATILRVFRSAVIGIVGWARMLWLLVQSYRDIRPLYKNLIALPQPVST